MDIKLLVIRLVGKFAFLLAGILLLCVIIFIQIGAQESFSWEKTDGLILSATISLEFYPEISYSYIIGGKEYTSTRISLFQTGNGTKRDAEAIISIYPPGKGVTVYYDPQNPGSAVLQTGIDAGLLIILYILAIFVLIAGIVVVIIVPLPSQERKTRKMKNRVFSSKLPLTIKPSTCLQCKKENPAGVAICSFCGSPDLKKIL